MRAFVLLQNVAISQLMSPANFFAGGTFATLRNYSIRTLPLNL
jgi:hypothetical protein